jgi:hypothetical protein
MTAVLDRLTAKDSQAEAARQASRRRWTSEYAAAEAAGKTAAELGARLLKADEAHARQRQALDAKHTADTAKLREDLAAAVATQMRGHAARASLLRSADPRLRDEVLRLEVAIQTSLGQQRELRDQADAEQTTAALRHKAARDCESEDLRRDLLAQAKKAEENAADLREAVAATVKATQRLTAEKNSVVEEMLLADG